MIDALHAEAGALIDATSRAEWSSDREHLACRLAMLQTTAFSLDSLLAAARRRGLPTPERTPRIELAASRALERVRELDSKNPDVTETDLLELKLVDTVLMRECQRLARRLQS